MTTQETASAAMEREIACVDEEIDKWVYVLYHLTEEEVKIIDREE